MSLFCHHISRQQPAGSTHIPDGQLIFLSYSPSSLSHPPRPSSLCILSPFSPIVLTFLSLSFLAISLPLSFLSLYPFPFLPSSCSYLSIAPLSRHLLLPSPSFPLSFLAFYPSPFSSLLSSSHSFPSRPSPVPPPLTFLFFLSLPFLRSLLPLLSVSPSMPHTGQES